MTATTNALIQSAAKAHAAHLLALRVRDRHIRRAVLNEGAGVRYVARETGLSAAQVSRICNPPAKSSQ